jgi:catechol 2,3-dioxygenase-like lactoylglutathione lyase family enzyme
MIPVQAIDHINLSVRDVTRSADFYRRVFGLEVREDRRDAERPYVIVGRPDVGYLALHEQRAPILEDERRVAGGPIRRDRINHWGFVVEGFDGLRDALERAGVEVLYRDNGADGIVHYPRSRSLYVADPDGNEIELTSTFGGGLG